MLDRQEEYEKMSRVESEHWWYRTLHRLVLNSLATFFSAKDIAILDAGCGTGGLMRYLKDNGYDKLYGFDLSDDAVGICRGRGFEVCQEDLRALDHVFHGQRFDVIVSNDTLCYLDRPEIGRFLEASYDRLNPGGVLICNLPALRGFKGIHDIAVGIRRRFTKKDIETWAGAGHWELVQQLYWPLLLSPMIFLVRLWQRIILRLNPNTAIRSDIDIPHPLINHFLAHVCDWDIGHLRHRPFGSSLFLVCRKRDSGANSQ